MSSKTEEDKSEDFQESSTEYTSFWLDTPSDEKYDSHSDATSFLHRLIDEFIAAHGIGNVDFTGELPKLSVPASKADEVRENFPAFGIEVQEIQKDQT